LRAKCCIKLLVKIGLGRQRLLLLISVVPFLGTDVRDRSYKATNLY
jgi:hypothetical protein